MSANSSRQLIVLLRQYERSEKSLVREMLKIEEILEERKRKLALVIEDAEQLVQRLSKSEGTERFESVRRGEARLLKDLSRFSTVLRKTTIGQKSKIQRYQKELNRAVDRLEIIEKELAEMRVEKKKVEKLIEENNRRANVLRAAREELSEDELAKTRGASDE